MVVPIRIVTAPVLDAPTSCQVGDFRSADQNATIPAMARAVGMAVGSVAVSRAGTPTDLSVFPVVTDGTLLEQTNIGAAIGVRVRL